VTRLTRLILLLQSSQDYLQPYSDPATSKYSGGDGAGAERKQTCVKCQGVRKMLGNGPCIICRDGPPRKHKCSKCERCNGKGSYYVNSYVGQVEGVPERHVSHGSNRKARKARGRQDMGDVIHHVVIQREQQWARGSYEDVEKALRKLQYEDEVAAYLVKAQYVEQRWDVLPSGATALAVSRGMERLLELTRASKLQVPARLMVKELDKNGHGTSEIARATGQSRSKVRRVRG
jgi:hypothetical protein